MSRLTDLRDMTATAFSWDRWEHLIQERGVTIDRPKGTPHPEHPSIIYPIDYGFVPGTEATDGHEVDVFVGSADRGLCALIITEDYRKRDREFKLLYNCSPEEIYLVNGFINFDRRLMEGELVMRRSMRDEWSL